MSTCVDDDFNERRKTDGRDIIYLVLGDHRPYVELEHDKEVKRKMAQICDCPQIQNLSGIRPNSFPPCDPIFFDGTHPKIQKITKMCLDKQHGT